jgi:hypothetical protein
LSAGFRRRRLVASAAQHIGEPVLRIDVGCGWSLGVDVEECLVL